MQWKEKPGDACGERAFQKESRPFVDQFSSEQPKQDYCPCSNRKEVAYRINESKNTHRCPPLLDPLIPLFALGRELTRSCLLLLLRPARHLRRRIYDGSALRIDAEPPASDFAVNMSEHPAAPNRFSFAGGCST